MVASLPPDCGRTEAAALDRSADEEWIGVGDCYSSSVLRREEVAGYLKGFRAFAAVALLVSALIGGMVKLFVT